MAYHICTDCIGCGACKGACPVYAISGEQKHLHRINVKRCVDCGVCGRVCPAGAVLNADGVRMERIPKLQWRKPEIDAERCSACAICVDTCAAQALRITPPKFKGDIRVCAELHTPTKCVSCSLCETRCPLHAITMKRGAAL